MFISLNPALIAADAAIQGDSAPGSPQSAARNVKSARAAEAIEKFEALFLSMMIKQLRQTENGDGLFPGDHSDTYGGLFDMMMGDHLASAGSLGFEKLLGSSRAMEQLEELSGPQTNLNQKTKGLKEYRNEQLRSGDFVAPTSA